MDVRCPQCQTLYELDDDQVGKRAVTLKCSQCQHVFRLGRSIGTEENQRRWMVRRKVEGDILYLDTFDSLHDWIMKRTISDTDEISRTGEKWVLLGEVGEFQPMFQVVESIAAMGADPSESAILTKRSDTPAAVDAVARSPHRERIRTSIQYGGASPEEGRARRTEDVTKKIRATDVLPDEIAAELEGEADITATMAEVAPAVPQLAARASLATADISRERPPERAPAKTSGIAIWIIVAAVGATAAAAYVWLFQQDDFLGKDAGVVAIGETSGKPAANAKSAPDPTKLLDAAVDSALRAAHSENDGIWTMWHETASRPFYVALDTAYTEADKATAGVELKQELRAARRDLENGRLKQASKAFRVILAKDPKNAGAVSGLGWALLELGQAKDAVGEFRRAIKMDANNGDAYIGLGSAHRQLGQLQDAYKAYDQYLGRFPKGPKASIASYQLKQLKKQLGM